MSHLHLECIGGASGDMLLGALVNLGPPLEELTRALQNLGTAPFRLVITPGESMHVTGVRLRVEIEGHAGAAEPAEPLDEVGTELPGEDHPPLHGHHHEDHDHAPHQPHHAHRALSDIEAMIAASALPEPVKADALRVFRLLGGAEAKIHGVPVEHIHFHEVGADDSILDIVGCCWAKHALGVTSVSTGPLPMGYGTIRCAHGVYPNPAPATLELTTGLPVVQTDEPFELVTPTGAALLAAWRRSSGAPSGTTLRKIGYGLGHRTLRNRPNLLRASLYDVETTDGFAASDTCLELACNLDDTTPELTGALMDEAFAAGALDVTITPVVMKKQRPGVIFTVLCPPELRANMLDILFRGSTTFGVREQTLHRTKLARRFETVETPFGPVRRKVGTWQGRDITHAPELEDCRRLAQASGVSVREVYEAAQRRSS